jgi:hypothetical protein
LGLPYKYTGPVLSDPLQGKNRSRRNLHGNEEESQKEKETLTGGETILAL